MFAVRMPKVAYFSHVTAALLLGLPIPWFLERDPRLHITFPPPARAPHASGIAGHRMTTYDDDVIARDGLRISSPARVWCDLAPRLSLGQLVALGDHLTAGRHPIVDRDTLTARASLAVPRRRGVRTMRAALPLLDPRSESPMESELRVILVLGGLVDPVINHVLVDTETGRDVRTDFAFPRLRFAIEYQGDYHRSRAQWRKDMTRRTRLEAEGWYVMELNADDLRDPVELLARIRAVLAGRGRAVSHPRS